MHHRYLAFGLKIESALELPELGDQLNFVGDPDVTILMGKVTRFSRGKGAYRIRSDWRDEGDFRFRSDDGTHYSVRDGRQIIVMVEPGAPPEMVRLYLLGSVFGALLLQRGYLVLHGNAIRIGNACLVCVGASGAGKSTLAAALLKRGFDVLADDVVAINGGGCAVPSFPRVKLWQDAADQLSYSTSGLARIAPDMDKYNVPIAHHDPDLRIPIRWVYLLSSENVDAVRIERIVGMRRFQMLRDNTYRGEYLHGEMEAGHLQQCGRLASQVCLRKLVRPRNGVPLDLLVDRLLEDIGADQGSSSHA